MILAPGFHVGDVLLVGEKIYGGLAELVTEPAAHPRREITRLGRGHSQILIAFDIGHVDGELRVRSDRKMQDRERQTDQSKSHVVRPLFDFFIRLLGNGIAPARVGIPSRPLELTIWNRFAVGNWTVVQWCAHLCLGYQQPLRQISTTLCHSPTTRFGLLWQMPDLGEYLRALLGLCLHPPWLGQSPNGCTFVACRNVCPTRSKDIRAIAELGDDYMDD
jgi:hypothetical protein